MVNKEITIALPTKFELYPDQTERLHTLGNIKMFDSEPKDSAEWLTRCADAQVVCTGLVGFRELAYELKDVFVSLPLVGVGWLDKDKLKQRNITVSYAPGCNKEAVAEWIVGMIINLFRQLPRYIRTTEKPIQTLGLTGKTICILGRGNIGGLVGKVCEALGMQVQYFLRGDNLRSTTTAADVVVNTLSYNSETDGLLNRNFFFSLKRGAYYVTVTSDKINDVTAILEALDAGVLAGVATDLGGALVKDVENQSYQEYIKRPNVMVTPHIAYDTDVRARIAYDMMIDNIEAWLQKKPKNLLI